MCDLFGRMFHAHLTRMCIVVYGYNILYMQLLIPIGLMGDSNTVYLLILCLDDLSIDVNGVLKSPTIISLLSISLFMSAKIFFLNLGAPLMGV